MSEFYRMIREYYDMIFPLNPQQVDFVRKNCGIGGRLLEVGCANGKLSAALSEFSILGVDLEEEFVATARERYPQREFRVLDLRSLDMLGDKQVFDGIICLGNTLVHVDRRGVEKFLHDAYGILRPGGRLLLQIVNYDYILRSGVHELPLIDNEFIRFRRIYAAGERFIFKGELLLKREEQQLRSEVELFPVLSGDLCGQLKNAGFRDIECFGDYGGGVYDSQSKALIISCCK